MEKLIIFLLIIGWAVLQARRKSIREQARKQSAQNRETASPMTNSRMAQSTISQRRVPRPPVPILGAVTAEENRELGPLESQRERWTDRAKAALGANEVPAPVQALIESHRKPDKATQDDERVEEIVAPSSEAAYEQTASVKTRISFAPAALRTFVVTREVLGPARFRNPHRLSIRSK